MYQIYPKSFNDTTGNGVGDLQGVIEKLDYLKKLGVDVIWLTPVYSSPQRDNGYDISDYYSIHGEYGTMEDFEELLEETHKRDMKLIMDLVVNHSSTEHEWFKQASSSKENQYRDFYIWNDAVDGQAPNNWISKFGGSAWKWDETTEQYYLHLFDETQGDLNWQNEEVRKEVYKLMKFWFEKGIDGFRLDVINLISKDQDFPNDDGSVGLGDGRKFYTDGPRVHEYLQEMNREVLSPYQAMTVGEMSSTTLEHCVKYSHPDRNELSMTFNFHHLKVDYPNGEKWALGEMDFLALKQILSKWQVGMHEGGGWNALFWCNHDQPRVVSRYGNDGQYHKESAKMLAVVMHMMQGTPYIYQGEEFGMTNPKFETIDEYRDVETLNMYEELKEAKLDESTIMEIIKQKSRDNSRTPVQWNAKPNGGFTTGTPWINTASNYKEINAVEALSDPNSIFYFYQKLVDLRKTHDIITFGDYQLIHVDHKQVFAYVRQWQDEKAVVLANFYEEPVTIDLPDWVSKEDAKVLLSNYEQLSKPGQEITLRPYEAVVYHVQTSSS